MHGWIDISEEVPDMANNHAHDLILWNCPVHNKTEAHQHPWKVRCGKDKQAEKAQPGIWVAP